MKRHIRVLLPMAEIILCLVLVLGRAELPIGFSTIIAFPFQPIALGLRQLSLSGSAGNLAAICLYIVLGLSPLLVLLRKKRLPEDSLLVVFSGLLLLSLYCMINPGLLSRWSANPLGSSFEAPLLGTILYSVLAAYGILRLIRCFFSADRAVLLQYLELLLYLLGLLLIYLICGSGLSNLLTSLETVRKANQGNEHLLGETNVFLVLQYTVSILPYLADLWVLHLVTTLLEAVRKSGYSETALTAARKLASFCGKALVTVVLAVCALNLAQLAFLKKLTQIDATVQLPLLSILFLLAALLFSQFIRESKQLQDDNQLFI